MEKNDTFIAINNLSPNIKRFYDEWYRIYLVKYVRAKYGGNRRIHGLSKKDKVI